MHVVISEQRKSWIFL